VEVKIYVLFISALKGGEWPDSWLGQSHPGKFQYPLISRLGRPKRWSGPGAKNIYLPLPGIKS